jgi:hypothetical protein
MIFTREAAYITCTVPPAWVAVGVDEAVEVAEPQAEISSDSSEQRARKAIVRTRERRGGQISSTGLLLYY